MNGPGPSGKKRGGGPAWFINSSAFSLSVCSETAHKSVAMGLLDVMLSWVNRVVLLVSVLLLTLMTLSKQDNLPLSRSTLLVGHLCSFRCVYIVGGH